MGSPTKQPAGSDKHRKQAPRRRSDRNRNSSKGSDRLGLSGSTSRSKSSKLGGAKSSRRKPSSDRRRHRGSKRATESEVPTEMASAAFQLQPVSNFRRRIPIAVKFAVPTALTVALFMGLLGYLTHKITYREIDQQINDKGVALVSTVASSLDRVLFGEVPDDLTVFEDEPELLKERMEERLEQVLKTLPAQFSQIVSRSKGEIINVLLTDYKGSSAVSLASGNESQQIRLQPLGSFHTRGSVEISEGRYTAGSLQDVRYRQYSRPIDADHPNKKVQVLLKADRIDEVTSNLGTRITLITLIGAGAGIIVAVIISMVLTGPIRALEQDIAHVAQGDLDHETLPRSQDEIGALAHTFNAMTQNLRVAQEAAVARESLQRELEIATEIQTKLLPERIPQIPGVDIYSFYQAAKEVGGDYYDFIVIDQHHMGIIVADVSGKGVPGSMVMTMFRSLIRLASVRNSSPSDTFRKVNRILAKDLRRGMFVTAVYMIFDVQSKTLRVASAGHNPSVLYRAATGKVELINPQGIALGFDKGPIFDNHIREQEIVLESGDRIAAYTDGVTEAMDEDGEEFGDDPFYELVRTKATLSSKDFVAEVVKTLEKHRGRGEQSDDITITTLAVQ